MVVKVGVRELRENLSSYLARVKEGDEVIVTERGATSRGSSRPRRTSNFMHAWSARGRSSRRSDRSSRSTSSKLPKLPPGPRLSDIVIAMRRGVEF